MDKHMTIIDQEPMEFDQAAEQTVELGNRLVEQEDEADSWEIASGVLAGAVHFWLYSRQPCGDLTCESCQEMDTAEKRLHELLEEVKQSAQQSDYYHTPYDTNVGRA
jgi:hypothetical protein